MKGFEDFLLTVLHAHVISAAKEILSEVQFENVTDFAKEIVVKYVNFDPDVKESVQDTVNLYALQVLNLWLILIFTDAIKEGDGNRVLICYKFFLLVYKAGQCHNYCKETINLLLQYNFFFTERQAEQLKWSRFINTKEITGTNISCDLHIEHLNRRLKGMIKNIHAKNPDAAIDRIAKSVGIINQVCETLEDENHSVKLSDRHS